MEDRGPCTRFGCKTTELPKKISRHGERGVAYLCMDVRVYTYLILCCDVMSAFLFVVRTNGHWNIAGCHRFQFSG